MRVVSIEESPPTEVPRARGSVALSVKAKGLDGLRQSGSLRCLFPRTAGNGVEAVLVNTAGGITGGDRFSVSARAGSGCTLALTTQAAERAYRAAGQAMAGRLETRLRVAKGARLDWLPQETILYDGCHFERELRVDLAAGARALIMEPLVFGRVESGEALRDIRFRDRIEIRQNGAPLFLDAMRINGDAATLLARPHMAAGARAMAALIYVAEDAEAQLTPLRQMLPARAGASLLGQNCLVLRLLAADSFELRTHLIPILQALHRTPLPKCWMI